MPFPPQYFRGAEVQCPRAAIRSLPLLCTVASLEPLPPLFGRFNTSVTPRWTRSSSCITERSSVKGGVLCLLLPLTCLVRLRRGVVAQPTSATNIVRFCRVVVCVHAEVRWFYWSFPSSFPRDGPLPHTAFKAFEPPSANGDEHRSFTRV